MGAPLSLALGFALHALGDHLFDTRIQVRDAAGNTPLIYQSAYLDPAGRTIKVSFRKLFF